MFCRTSLMSMEVAGLKGVLTQGNPPKDSDI